MKPKILVAHSWNAERGLYGSDRVLLRILKKLAPIVEPIVVVESEGEFADLARGIPCTVVVHAMGVLRRNKMNPVGLLMMAFETLTATLWLAHLITRNNVVLVFTNSSSVVASALAAKIMRRPHIWLVQEILGGYVRALSLLVVHLSTKIVAVSEAAAQSVHRGRAKFIEKVQVAYPGVDAEAFDSADGKALREEFCSAQRPILIGHVARIHHWKGQDYFLDALYELKKRGVESFRALIVGEVYPGYEGLRRELAEKVRRFNLQSEVIFCGHRNDVGSIFKAVDIAVSPSTLPEPFGLVIAEAMAARRPVIATDSGGPSEIIQDRVNGFLIPRNDPVTFSKRLEELIQDPDLRTRVGDAAATRIRTKFSAHAFDWEIRAIIECIVFSRPAGRHVRTRRIV